MRYVGRDKTLCIPVANSPLCFQWPHTPKMVDGQEMLWTMILSEESRSNLCKDWFVCGLIFENGWMVYIVAPTADCCCLCYSHNHEFPSKSDVSTIIDSSATLAECDTGDEGPMSSSGSIDKYLSS